ncbi:hypothetical protein LCGC14_0548930 [marine sediment metagenome]|uniref:Uncharacterized protein n=1 Tax=marine sediment metagenome TaxID=412755 RepID=A0A0F9UYY4_9ZZZZ
MEMSVKFNSWFKTRVTFLEGVLKAFLTEYYIEQPIL